MSFQPQKETRLIFHQCYLYSYTHFQLLLIIGERLWARRALAWDSFMFIAISLFSATSVQEKVMLQ